MKRTSQKLKDNKVFLVLVSLITLLGGLLYFRNFLFFVVIASAAGMLHFLGYRYEIKFNFGHVFFLSLLFTRIGHLLYGILLLLFSGIIPQVLAGDIDQNMLVSYPIQITVVLLSGFLEYNVIFTGIVLSLVCYSATMFLGKIVGVPLPEMITEQGLPLFLNIIYFFSASGSMIFLLQLLFVS